MEENVLINYNWCGYHSKEGEKMMELLNAV
jgi:hypothetical protein